MPDLSKDKTFSENSVVFIGIVNAALDVAFASSAPAAGPSAFSRTLIANVCSAITATAVLPAATPAAGTAALAGSPVLRPGPCGRLPIKSATLGAKLSLAFTTSPNKPVACRDLIGSRSGGAVTAIGGV